MSNPTELALVRKALDVGISGCVEWNTRVVEQLVAELSRHGLTLRSVRKNVIEYVRNGGEVFQIKEEREQSVYIQTDWDYPGTASSFGWSVGCDRSTDGTVDCQHKTASEHIASAYDYLCENIGKVVEDSGYF